MKIIKGLILKDLYVFKNYKKNIYFSGLIFIVILFMAAYKIDILAPGSIIFLIFFGLNSISTFSYDENAKTNRYLLALPLNRQNIVQAKYLFTFLNSALALILGFIISLIISFLVGQNIPDIINSLKIIFLAFTSATLLLCTDIPCIYKWDVEKGRMQATLIPILIIFIGSFIIFTLWLIFPNLYNLFKRELLWTLEPIICLIVNILIYLISYKISLKIFLKKEI